MTHTASVRALVVAFAGLGGTAAVIPAVLPTAIARHPADAEAYLQAAPATFTGLLVGVLLSSVLIRATSTRLTLVVGFLLQATGLAFLITMPPSLVFLLATGAAGLGFGLVEAAGSVWARESAGDSVTRLLAALTGTVAVVAAACPLIVAFLPVPNAALVALVLVVGIHLAGVVCMIGVGGTSPRRAGGPLRAGRPADDRAATRSALRRLIPVAVGLALYVGVESVFSGWSAVITGEVIGASPQRAAVGTSAFWISMAVGRFAAWLIFRSRAAGVRQLVLILAAAAVLIVIAGVTTDRSALGIAALCGAVVLLGPCYSMIVGIALVRLPTVEAARVTGPLVGCGAVGGAAIPWLALAATGKPTGPAVFILTAVLLLFVALLLAWPTHSRTEK